MFLMKLIPYTYSSLKRQEKIIHTIRILKEGTQIWTEGELKDPLTEALEPNGLFTKRTFQEAHHLYFQIDPEKTDMGSMYDYRECELSTEILCWHTLHVITDNKGHLWIDLPSHHLYLQPILKAHYVDI
jgi:hypothetical protein